MAFLRVLFLFFFFKCVISEFDKESLFKPCPKDDVECTKKSFESFFVKTAAGIPEYNIKPIDPVFLPMVCVEGGKDIMIHYKNVSILGLKDSKVTDYKLDPTAKSEVLSTKQDVRITANIMIELEDKEKTFQGTWEAEASTVCIAHYNHTIVKDDKGIEYYEIIPGAVNCESPELPKVTLDKDLQKALKTDRDANSKKDEYRSHHTETLETAVEKIMNEAFANVIHNIGAACKVLPVSKFDTNV